MSKVRESAPAVKYVVAMEDPSPKYGGIYYWIGVQRAAGIAFASWTCDAKDATQYRTKREAERVCAAHKKSRPKAANRYAVVVAP